MNWLGKDSEGSGSGLLEVLSRNLSGGPEKHHENPQDSLCPGRDSKRTPNEYKTGALPWYHLVRFRSLCYLTTLFQLKMLHSVICCGKIIMNGRKVRSLNQAISKLVFRHIVNWERPRKISALPTSNVYTISSNTLVLPVHRSDGLRTCYIIRPEDWTKRSFK
jgi:hypothetical protein